MNGELRNKRAQTELDIRQKLVGQQCRIYYDTRRERVKLSKYLHYHLIHSAFAFLMPLFTVVNTQTSVGFHMHMWFSGLATFCYSSNVVSLQVC
jgi:hypothetical protein